MKKVFALTLAVALSLPIAGAFAEGKHGKWTKVGTDTFTTRSKIVKSGGGDFKFCLVSGSGGYFNLYEEDHFGDNDDYNKRDVHVKTVKLTKKSKCATIRNVNRYVDGFDGQAEFYLTKRGKEKVTVTFWD